MNLRLVLLALVVASVAGCGRVNSAQPSNWNQCNALAPPPVTYAQTVGSGTVPTPLGGTIVPGTYDLTSQTVYGASSLIANVPPETYVFDAATFRALTRDYAAGVGTWWTSKTTLTLKSSCLCKVATGCDQGTTNSFWYTATPTQLVYIETYANGGIMVQTFTRR